MLRGERIIRALDRADPAPEFRILGELVARGFVAYAALPLALAPGRIGGFTVASRRPFRPDVLPTLEQLLPALALLVELHESRRFSATLLDTYLGHGPGLRVLNGAIRRGDVTGLQAALWYADLRGFTETALNLSPEQTIAHINPAFEVMEVAVGTTIAGRPPHRSGRAELPQTAGWRPVLSWVVTAKRWCGQGWQIFAAGSQRSTSRHIRSRAVRSA